MDSPPLPEMVQPSAASLSVFLGIVCFLGVMFVLAVGRAAAAHPHPTSSSSLWVRRGIYSLVAWLTITAAIARSGVLRIQMLPPPSMLFFALIPLTALVLSFSPLGKLLALQTPLAWLVGFQGFRIPLELVLHRWYEEGVIPIQMTFAGLNFDIVSGVLGLGLGLWTAFGKPPRASYWVFNVVGLGLLLWIVRIVILTSPFPWRAYHDGPPLLLIFYVPTVWIGPVCVLAALLGHLLLFRRLVQQSPS